MLALEEELAAPLVEQGELDGVGVCARDRGLTAARPEDVDDAVRVSVVSGGPVGFRGDQPRCFPFLSSLTENGTRGSVMFV